MTIENYRPNGVKFNHDEVRLLFLSAVTPLRISTKLMRIKNEIAYPKHDWSLLKTGTNFLCVMSMMSLRPSEKSGLVKFTKNYKK